MSDQKTRKGFRVFALVWSGILVLFIFPIGAAFASLYLDNLFGLHLLIIPLLRMTLSVICLINGFFWSIWANIALYQMGKGSPVPLKNTETINLVVRGPYKYSRNPMIFGYIFIWIGLGIFLNSAILLFGFSFLVTVLLIIFVKFWEEKNLEERFGQSYLDYIKKTSFLIPLP